MECARSIQFKVSLHMMSFRHEFVDYLIYMPVYMYIYVLLLFVKYLNIFTIVGLVASRNLASETQLHHMCRSVLSEVLEVVCGTDLSTEKEGKINTKKRKGANTLRTSTPKRMANPFRLFTLFEHTNNALNYLRI